MSELSLPIVLGVDPGFASTGIAIVRLLPDASEEVVLLDVIRTAKSVAKARTFASDDNVRRTREIARRFEQLIVQHGVRAIVAESMSFPRNSTNAAKMSLCWGALVAVAELHDLPLVQASPQAIKAAVAGSKSADKSEVEFALLQKYGNALGELFEGPDGLREHCFDALGAVVACLGSDVIRALRPREAAPVPFESDDTCRDAPKVVREDIALRSAPCVVDSDQERPFP